MLWRSGILVILELSMVEILHIIAKTVSLGLSAIQLCMLLRMLLPLFIKDPEGNSIYKLTFFASEMVVTPVRVLFDKMGIGKHSPFDWAFLAGYFLLILIQSFLPVI